MTRQITDMEEEKKILTENLEQYKIEAAKVFCYPVIEKKALGLGLTFIKPDSTNKFNMNLTSLTK